MPNIPAKRATATQIPTGKGTVFALKNVMGTGVAFCTEKIAIETLKTAEIITTKNFAMV
ncbi:MAG: hypothetical protein ACFB0D_14050 [Phormidesmis sp.]